MYPIVKIVKNIFLMVVHFIVSQPLLGLNFLYNVEAPFFMIRSEDTIAENETPLGSVLLKTFQCFQFGIYQSLFWWFEIAGVFVLSSI